MRVFFRDLRIGFKPIKLWHMQVENHNIWLVLMCHPDRFAAIESDCHHFDLVYNGKHQLGWQPRRSDLAQFPTTPARPMLRLAA